MIGLEYLHTSENVPVNLFSRVDLPTEGKPTRPTLESPLLVTSKPSPAPPAPFDEGVRSSLRSFASLAWHQTFTNNESTPQQKQQQNTGKQKRNLKSSKKGTTRNKILMILMEGWFHIEAEYRNNHLASISHIRRNWYGRSMRPIETKMSRIRFHTFRVIYLYVSIPLGA